jgi:peroxiredoxin
MINTGDKAPDFTLKNHDNEDVNLSSFQGKSNVVLLFFPFAFSSVCTDEMCTMRDNMKIYEGLDAEVLGISVDSFFTLKEFRKGNNLNFNLLSDFNKEVSTAYGALYDEFFGNKGVSKRSAFVIDKEGKVRFAWVSDDAGKQPDYNAIRETLNELK